MNKRFGYARVSSKEQNLDRQLDALTAKSEDGSYKYLTSDRDLFTEKQSGKDFNRPQWQALKNMLRAGDELTVLSLDRLGRDYEQIKQEWQDLSDMGVKIRVLDMPTISTTDRADDDLTSKLISDITLSLLAYVAETERQKIKERQRQGIESARAQGKHLGRPKQKKPAGWPEIVNSYRAGELTGTQAAEKAGMSRAMFYKLLKQESEEN